jgi:two-component system, chemotaxis family, chemotaxis protein CheY
MRRVLVVEDSVSARAFVRAILEEPLGEPETPRYEVFEATGGFDAMRLLPRGPYDLIVTDINMTDINGLELIRFIRQSAHHTKTPIIVISSLRGKHEIDRAFQAGANEYLAKPFTADELRATCERAVLAATPSTAGATAVEALSGRR